MRTIAVINQKGGCGKTTTAINLAGVFASRGLRTLLVDVDPQSHCAAGLAIPEQRIDLDIGDAMLDPGDFDPARLLWRVSRNLDLAPARMKLAGLEASRGGLSDRPNKERALSSVLERLAPQYDACCIDCPPGIGLLTYNALVAADTVLIPVETSYFSLRGAAKQIDTLRSVSRRLGVQTPYWLLATIHDESSALARDLLSELRREYESRVCPVIVRFDPALKEASSFGQSIIDYAPESNGAQDYKELAEWWLGQSLRPKAIDAPAPAGDPPVVHVSPDAGRAMIESKAPPPADGLDGSGGAQRQATPTDLDPTEPTAGPLDPVDADPPVPTAVVTPTAAVIAETERALSRTEDLVRRALQLNQRGGLAETPRPALVHLIDDDPTPVVETPGPMSRLLGVRQTSRGTLFIQPLSVGRTVSIAGDFNGWDPTQHVMRPNKGLGVFELVVPLPQGVHSYRLVIDGVWKPDPFNPSAQPNPYGEPNSIVRVK